MTVLELIDALRKCDPTAPVLINDEPIIDDGENVNEGAMQVVLDVEAGWSYRDISSDMTFSPTEVPGYLFPAVRLVGVNNTPTDPNKRVIINGVPNL